MTNPVRHHAWGSVTDIPSLLGIQPDGKPHAELWLGAYEDESSTVSVGSQDRRLCDVVADSGGERLPFLAKVLAIGSPLSLQLHPGSGEDVKPELLYALEPCRVLCGLRPVAVVCALLGDLPPLRGLAATVTDQPESLRGVMARLLAGEPALVEAVATALRGVPRWAAVARTVDELRAHHPRDAAVLASLLLERVDLRAGEAMFCAPGRPHTYLAGVGFEVQASSDATVRGGLTDKPVDVDRFVAELDTTPGVQRVPPRRTGVEDVYDAGVPEFALGVVQASQGALAPVAGPQILLCARGRFAVSDSAGTVELGRGEAAYVPGAECEQSAVAAVGAYGSGLLLRVSAGRAR